MKTAAPFGTTFVARTVGNLKSFRVEVFSRLRGQPNSPGLYQSAIFTSDTSPTIPA